MLFDSLGRALLSSLIFGAELKAREGEAKQVEATGPDASKPVTNQPHVKRPVLLDQEIVALREELSVLNRLARAQDRKFEGCQGYALNRRLWLAEEELRLARSTISTLGAEVAHLSAPDLGIFGAFFASQKYS